MKQNKQSNEPDSSTDTKATVEERDNSELDSEQMFECLQQLIEIAERADLATARIRNGDLEIEISRTTTHHVGTTPILENATMHSLVTENETGDDIIRSPMPARFYRSPAPDEPPFVEVGDSVSAGTSIATLEVMKTYNDVDAPFDCEILEILVEDGQAVEFNQALFRVRQS